MRVTDEICYPMVLVASLEFAFAQSRDSMVEFDKVLAIRDPD